MTFRLLAGVLSASLACVAASQPASVPLGNPGFEDSYFPVGGNSGSIAGMTANGWSDNSTWANATVAYSRETINPHSGASCQKIVVGKVPDGEMQFLQPVSLVGGSIYTASVWMRGEPGTRVTLRIQKSGPPYTSLADDWVQLTSDWQQVTAQGYVTTGTAADLMIAMQNPGTVWVDDAALSYSPGKFAPTPNVGLIPRAFFGMHVGNFLSGGVSNPGFEPPFTSAGENNPISGQVAANWSDNSTWADVAVDYSADTNRPHGGTSAQKVSVQAVRSGAVQLTQGVEVRSGKVYTFSAWLRGDPGMTVKLIVQQASSPYTYYAYTPVQLSGDWQRFTAAGQVNGTGSVLLMFQATKPGAFSVDDVEFTGPDGRPVAGGVPWPAVRFGTLRLWDSGTTWAILEPSKGVWNFNPLDAWVAAADAGGIADILLTLGQSPPWASSQPDTVSYNGAGAPAPPRDIQDWRDYVTAVAHRYKGRIRYYEIWNEPNDATFYTGTVDQLVALTREASAILKAVDPGNTVISPPAYSAGYLDDFLFAGGAQDVDVIGHHFYATPPEDTAALMANVRLVMAKRGVQSLPLWETEGASGDTTTPLSLAPAYMVRKHLVDLALGAGRYGWYTWGPATGFCVATVESDPSVLSPAGEAYRRLIDWLDGASLVNAVIDETNTWQIFLTLAGGDNGLVVWNPAGARTFTVPGGFRTVTQRDLAGGVTTVDGRAVAISETPVLLSYCCQALPVVKAVTHAASFIRRLSPGSLATIFGSGLAPSVAQAGSMPLPLTLDGVAVSMDGLGCPLLYADSGQVNFQVPSELENGSHILSLTTSAAASNNTAIVLEPAAPGIFVYDRTRAVATDSLGILNSPSSPAPAGSALIVYLTGIGSVTNAPPSGYGAPGEPLAYATLPVQATIGGIDAHVEFLGLTPGFVGLAQANVRVPQLPAGDYPLVLTVNGVAAAPATVSISAAP